MISAIDQGTPLALRAIFRTIRQPQVVLPGLLFPLFIFAFVSGALGKTAVKLPGFPTSSYVTFALGLLFAFIGIYAVIVAGGQLGEDVQTGFIRRLSLTATNSFVVLTGQLAGVIVFAVCQAVFFLAVGFAVGAHVEAGAGGVVLLVGFAALNAAALGSVGLAIALRTGSGQAVQGMLPIFMSLLFLASLMLPRDLIQAGWFRVVATYNPLSYLIEAPRSLLVAGWEAEPLALGAAVSGAIFLGALVLTANSMRALSVRR
jgi:ABC-2 type transport system permease protein